MSKYIIGAYPCAPSFHYKNEADETKFFNILKQQNDIAGLEQPYLESFHPLGNDFFFKTIKDDWKIVITAVMYTMGKRGQGLDYGLASQDESLRTQAVEHIKKILSDMQKYGPEHFKALQIQSAPSRQNFDYSQAVQAFEKSIQEIMACKPCCPIMIEHCDNIHGKNIRKGFLELKDEISLAKQYGLGICINWARSVLETGSVDTPVDHLLMVKQQQLPVGLLFSGTATGGAYGALGDNHCPFKTFSGSRVTCDESLMSIEEARRCIKALDQDNCLYLGSKLLEIDEKASVEHRANILLDAVDAINQAK